MQSLTIRNQTLNIRQFSGAVANALTPLYEFVCNKLEWRADIRLEVVSLLDSVINFYKGKR